MRVLLIGGAGFIGRRVVERLRQRGHEVTIFHRGQSSEPPPDTHHITGNRLEIDQHIQQIDAVDADAAIDFLPWNDRDTRRVINTLNGRVERVVHLSSGDVYRAWGKFLTGGFAEPVPLTEDAPLRDTLYPYAGVRPGMEDYDKVLAEREVLQAHYEEGYPGIILRLPVVYGPQDTQHHTWPFVKRILDERPAILLSGCRAAWLWQRGFVDNVAFGIVLAAERQSSVGRIYNIGSAQTYTMATWVRTIGDVLGWQGEVVVTPRESLPESLRQPYNYQQHILFDTGLARRELGYYELVKAPEAIKATVEWQAANPPDSYDPAHFNYEDEDRMLKGVNATTL